MSIEFTILTLTVIFGFYMAWNIGANDVSNAMGTSVGSRALTLKRAVFLAAILEFSGAYLMGGNVSSTIQQGIVNPHFFDSSPLTFVLGMMGALLATGLWLNVACYLNLPVSTTHAIVGAVIGFGVIIGGFSAVKWDQMGYIVLSWICTPIVSGFLSYLIFLLIQKKILFTLTPLSSTKKLTPLLVFFIFFIFSFTLFYKGMINKIHFTLLFALITSISIGFFMALLAYFLLKRVRTEDEVAQVHSYEHVNSLKKAIKHLQRTKLSSTGETFDKTSEILSDLKKLTRDLEKELEYNKSSLQYTKVEKIFAILQIISACFVAFGHGANDVANAIGPVAAVVQVIKSSSIPDIFYISPTILLYGGIGIVVGLATWGWRVIETIGHKITELTPTRGFTAELGSAITILFASKLGMPISTTHALVGSVFGVGIARGFRSLNLKTIKGILLSWFATIPLCAIMSILIFYLLKAIFRV